MTAPPPPSAGAAGRMSGSARDLLFDRNRAAVLAFEFLWGLAMPFVYHGTVIPGFLRHLDAPNVWIGLVPAIHCGGLGLVQPLSAYAIRPGGDRVARMRQIYALGACAYAVLGLLVLLGVRSAGSGLAAALLALLLFSVAVGLGDPHYMGVVVDAVPAEQRGRFFGLRAIFLGLGGIAGGVLSAWLLASGPAPRNFGLAFLAGGMLYVLSTASMRFYRDAAAPAEAPRAGFRSFMAERMLPHVRQPEFRSFLVAVVLFSFSIAGFAFLSLLLRDRLDAGDRLFGILGGLFMACNLVMSWLFGVVCDRWGARRGFALTLCLYAAGVLGCLFFRDRTALLFSYLLACAWMPGQLIAVTDLALRLGGKASPAEITALMMAAVAPARILGPVAVGAAVDRWSYGPPLLACLGCAALALAVLAAPRLRRKPVR